MKKFQITIIVMFIFLSAVYKAAEPITWKFKTGGQIHASAVIYDDIVYIGNFDSCFYALDAKTGLEKWHYKTQNQIYSNAVKYNNIIVFESGNILYGLNLQGGLEWQDTLYNGECVNQHDQWDYYHSSPLLVDSIIYIGSEKGKVYGINAHTGEPVFECQTPSANFTIETTPAVYDNKIYFGDWDGVFFAYDLTTAQMVWSYDTKKDGIFSGWVNAIVTDPVIIGDEVFFGGRSCKLYCLDAKSGNKKWSTKDPGGDTWTLGGPTYADGILYMGSSYQHTVRAYSAVTGILIWQKDAGNRINGKPCVTEDYVIVGTEHNDNIRVGGLVLMDRNNKGQIISQLNLKAQVYSSPLLKDNLIYFGATDSSIYAVNYEVMHTVPIITTNKLAIQCGNVEKTASFDTTLYVYNIGFKTDSISITNTMKEEVTVSPRNFYLAPGDSQKVSITVNPAGLSARKYTCNLEILSNNSLPATTLKRSIVFTVTETSTDVSPENKEIKSFLLEQNYPNPFNPSTLISYQLPELSKVKLKIYNIMGKEVATLVDKEQDTGIYQVAFDGKGLSSGIYLCKIEAGTFNQTRKMILLK